MRKTMLTAAAAVAAALAVSGEATAAGSVKSETLWLMDASSTSEVFGVIATGAFTDAGTVIINGPGKHAATIHLSHGTIKAQARFTEPPQVHVNPRTCFESEHSAGTLELLEGTGAYRRVSGSGKFTQAANEIVPEAHGKCSFSGDAFLGSQQTITAHLDVSLP
jgi:hypothetical protein